MPLTDAHLPYIAILGTTREKIAALPRLEGVIWVGCEQTGPGVYEFRKDDRRIAELDFANPVFALGELIAVVGSAGDAKFQALKSAWAEGLVAKALTFLPAQSFAPVDLMAAAINALSERLAAQQMQCARSALDLAVYRDEFDRLEYSFAALEAYVMQTGVKTPRDLFFYPVGSDSVDLANQTLTQVLPINSIGVSGVAISFSSVPPAGSPTLDVALRCVETGKMAAVWQLNPAGTRIGWTSLLLDRAIDEIALTLVLEITWAPGGTGWRVDLGPPHPNPVMCARPHDGPPLPAPIAMRILGSVPGMLSEPTAAVELVSPAAPRQSPSVAVPRSVYEAVTRAGGDAAEGIPLVVYDADAEFIQVHPNGPGKVTAAQMVITPQIPAWRLSAHIHLAHEKANQTDFGLLVREESEPLPDFAHLAKDLGGQPGFSGWHSLVPMEHGMLSVLLSGAPLQTLNVYLLTKQNGTHEFAWARFSDLQLHLGPPTPP